MKRRDYNASICYTGSRAELLAAGVVAEGDALPGDAGLRASVHVYPDDHPRGLWVAARVGADLFEVAVRRDEAPVADDSREVAMRAVDFLVERLINGSVHWQAFDHLTRARIEYLASRLRHTLAQAVVEPEPAGGAGQAGGAAARRTGSTDVDDPAFTRFMRRLTLET